MRTNYWNLLLAFATFVPVMLFSFSWFCLSRMAEMSNQLTNCKNHILEFKGHILHLQNRSKNNHEQLMKALSEMQDEVSQRKNQSRNLDEKKRDAPSEGEIVSNIFEDFKFFLPHLRKVKRIYPKVIIGQGKTGVSFALGVPTVSRGNYTYLKQTLNAIVTRIMPWEEKDSVVIVSIADSNGDYVKSVVDMVTKRFKRQVKSGSLEVISVPDFFYPSMLHEEPMDYSQRKKRWHIKQVLDFCVLMAYAQPKATYYLQLEDDIIAKEMYFTKLTRFVNNMTSNDWLYINFSVLGFIGKLFKSEDLAGFVHFFLMFHKERPIDLLLDEFFHIKICDVGEKLEKCKERKREIQVEYKPSLFQHVGIHSSLPGREQYLKDYFY
ncbi:alpha-1,3-mannosyl-glycoprotein 4-beta-N-acetylglucosaminyltransferase-like protein MGAT4D [Octodon degus]|uniref:Alpha-1,3-mannosyl-glycoprotein 4-beta-N-acetylglucosaminyltransferase-like protein MGAT4D n=1 Tax=Octodon degus TaxID=10160 RepID=A0A6P6DIR9_OCTDE|nr:alpha-1,3-mannosyl-glycoprotein 4-beta-N-acetylglucosaminyltransferase-like protein MGAT4D [Octodon degus]